MLLGETGPDADDFVRRMKRDWTFPSPFSPPFHAPRIKARPDKGSIHFVRGHVKFAADKRDEGQWATTWG